MSRAIEAGNHHTPEQGKCLMEWRYYLCTCASCTDAKQAGEWTDKPPCSPRSLLALRTINDRMTAAGRQRLDGLLPLIPSLSPDVDRGVLARVERRVALWCARRVEHLAPPEVKACNDVVERYLNGDATLAELRAGKDAARAARRAAAWAAAEAEAAEAEAAAAEAEAARDDALYDFACDLVDAWHKIAADEGLLGAVEYADYIAVGGS